jgi:methionine-gamma-lyase
VSTATSFTDTNVQPGLAYEYRVLKSLAGYGGGSSNGYLYAGMRVPPVHRQGSCILVVDNTFTPMVVSPARLGADIVIHSMTKFINGASDVIAGCICCSRDFGHSLYDLHTGRVMLMGPVIDPRAAFDLIQRLPHLGLRMREHSRRALAIATHLESLGFPVIHPGLPSHPQHQLLESMANEGYGFGGILCIDCGSHERANRLLSNIQNENQFGLIAVSLGYYDTLMSCSASSTSFEIPEDERQQMGLHPGLVRLSIGYTGSLESRLQQIADATRKALGT